MNNYQLTLLAQMVEGEADTAEWFFLFGVILFVIGAIGHFSTRHDSWSQAMSICLYAGLAFVSLGFFVL